MKIIFNLIGCNLGNNGGSQTIIRMAEELKNIGHDVIVATVKNNFTWFQPSEGLIKLYNNIEEVPECDFIIATACSTVKSTLQYPKLPIGRKLYWIRGYETWAMTKSELAKGYTSGLTLLVNSEWQKEFLYSEFNVESKIQYSGVPISEIRRLKVDFPHNEKFIIGALYNPRPMKRFDDVLDICNMAYKMDLAKEFIFFGDSQFDFEKNNIFKLPITYHEKPSMKRKIEMMSKCDIWLSTSINEGLHIPPLEAGLSGCLLVARNLRSSGVSDYAVNNVSAKTFLSNDEAIEKIAEYYDEIRYGLIHFHFFELTNIIMKKIGDVRLNAIRFGDILQEMNR